MRQTRQERKQAQQAADQAEYETSLQRAKEAAQDQAAAAHWPNHIRYGVAGLLIDQAKRRKSLQ
jgi:hypothetical protein